jgi:hypothetical protein
LTPPQSALLVAVHSVHAPLSGPERWHAGRAGSGQLGAPSLVQATQVRVVLEHTGVTPPHWLSSRQATHTPRPELDETSQRGADAGQWLVSAAVQAVHAPDGRQIGVAPPHSASDAQARQTLAVPSHTGVVPPQPALLRQPTHAPTAVAQTGVAPVQRVAFVIEHCPHAPEPWQAGSAPPQSLSAAQPRQTCGPRSQTGVATPQTLESRHCTHVPAGV